MDACLQSSVSCHLIATIIRLRKKDIGKIEKKMLGLCTTLCVCVFIDYICALYCVVV